MIIWDSRRGVVDGGSGFSTPVRFITGWGSTPLLRNSRFFHFYSKLWFSQHPCIEAGMRGVGGSHPGAVASTFRPNCHLKTSIKLQKENERRHRFTKTRLVEKCRENFSRRVPQSGIKISLITQLLVTFLHLCSHKS